MTFALFLALLACAADKDSEETGLESDSLVDGLDSDCTDECPEDCTDGVDNDADGFVDCLDNECSSSEECIEDCTDGVDTYQPQLHHVLNRRSLQLRLHRQLHQLCRVREHPRHAEHNA